MNSKTLLSITLCFAPALFLTACGSKVEAGSLAPKRLLP